MKTGLNIIMACNIPKNNPLLEVSFFLCAPFGVVLLHFSDFFVYVCVVV